jgi:mannosyl-oligosaccharide glucosidase
VVDVKVDISTFRTRHPNNGDCPSSHPQYLFPMGDGNGNILIQKQYDYTVDDLVLSHIPRIGYVTIFPLLLKLIDCKEHSSQLTHILDIVQSPDHLWSPYGLRSISKSDLFYQVENAPGDSPYWR